MKELLDQMEFAAQNGLYYLGLFSALAIPDICAAIQDPSGQSSGPRYAAWFDSYVAAKYTVGPNHAPSLTGADCYKLRCSMLHQGRAIPHSGATISRVLFYDPMGQTVRLHGNQFNTGTTVLLQIGIPEFCHDMAEGARAWLTSKAGDPTVQQNLGRFLRVYPSGFGPITGLPVIT